MASYLYLKLTQGMGPCGRRCGAAERWAGRTSLEARRAPRRGGSKIGLLPPNNTMSNYIQDMAFHRPMSMPDMHLFMSLVPNRYVCKIVLLLLSWGKLLNLDIHNRHRIALWQVNILRHLCMTTSHFYSSEPGVNK